MSPILDGYVQYTRGETSGNADKTRNNINHSIENAFLTIRDDWKMIKNIKNNNNNIATVSFAHRLYGPRIGMVHNTGAAPDNTAVMRGTDDSPASECISFAYDTIFVWTPPKMRIYLEREHFNIIFSQKTFWKQNTPNNQIIKSFMRFFTLIIVECINKTIL